MKCCYCSCWTILKISSLQITITILKSQRDIIFSKFSLIWSKLFLKIMRTKTSSVCTTMTIKNSKKFDFR
jgi:hypothetical protein